MSDHATAALLANVKRAVSALRLACEDLRAEPTKIGVNLVLQLSEELSGNVAGLARVVDLTTLDVPTASSRGAEKAGPDLLDLVAWITASIEGKACVACGRAVRAAEEEPEVTGEELSRRYIARERQRHEKEKNQ